MVEPVLFDYWRSTASYRVRIALGLKGLFYKAQVVDLLAGAQKASAYRQRNPQSLLPSLQIDDQLLTQSLSIVEYLEETRPEPALLPADALGRARVRALSYAVAMDIHPVCNLRVVNHVVGLTGGGEAGKRAWMQHFIGEGLDALEAMLTQSPASRFSYGDSPTMADLCLVPQLYNARRWELAVDRWPRLTRIDTECAELEAFRNAHPDVVGPQ